ncbi:1,4-dihydropyridine esterase [Streptomyces paludis]|uniref:1,4-dihydropyridine esterase n=2 Tax=Streptomyces paludis TaxID=2282738 RepID=A0A345HRH6_9ACTN|nr:1,4-dihydropyridine esterase [Streptomyces paludis]
MVAALLTAGLTSGAASGATSGTAFGTTSVSGPGGAGDTQQHTAPGTARNTASVITLITGDRVYVNAEGRVIRVQPGEGRENIRMSITRSGDSTYVFPSDALALIGQRKVDRRLFDVTGLLKAKYDDAHRGSVPLIVSYGKNRATAKAALAEADVSVRRTLPTITGEALSAPKDESSDVWDALTEAGDTETEERTTAPGIERVWLDGKLKALLDKSVPQIGAPTAWQAGYDGKGVKVAVLDTGVDQTNPDLKGVSILRKDFSGSGSTVDKFGHGTHVASTLAGSGAKSGGKFKGVAPGAKILDGKVLGDDGFGGESGIIAGMQWAADQGAKIVNMSLGREDVPEVDPLEAAVERISAQKDVLFVVAAGNEGPEAKTIGSPGSAPSALTVGAVDRKNKIADFSSVGPTADGSLKPDITAPGVDIVAAKAAKGFIGDPATDGYVALSGTSMATPHVAGAAAILAQQHPDWTGRQIKQALISSAKPSAGLTPYQQGAGRTDLTKAITQTVLSEQASLNFGMQQWPHADDKPITQQITYRNTGTAPVTLDLTLETIGPKGKAAPAGFFTTGAPQITVPAGGTARVDLTANTSVGSQDGVFAGTLVAKAATGGQSVRTTFAVERESEAHTLTLKYLDTKGKPSQSGTQIQGHGDNAGMSYHYDEDGDGTVKVRLPKGTYLLDSAVSIPTGQKNGTDYALMVQPKLSLTKNTTVTFDARKTKPVNITAPGSAKQVQGYLNYALSTKSTYYSSIFTFGSFKGIRTGHVGPTVTAKEFDAQLGGVWQKGSTTYNLVYNRTGSLHPGLTHKVAASELALMNLKIGASNKNRKGKIATAWELPSGSGFEAESNPFALPATAKTYVNVPKGAKWSFAPGQLEPRSSYEQDVSFDRTSPAAYQPKKTYTKTFNVGVMSPRIGRADANWRWGNELNFCVEEFTDSSGNVVHSEPAKQRTVVTRDGKQLLNVKDPFCQYVLPVPAASAKYRISTDVTRPAKVTGVSTRLVAAWTFLSKKPSGGNSTPLPLSSVRFAPKLDLASTAPAGKKFTVPLTIQGPAAKNFKSLAVQVSYDGGKKWSKAPVNTKSGKRSLALTHPKKAKSVSFKAKLTDKSGNVYDVTIEKAYLLK